MLEDIRKRHTAGYVTKFASPLEVIADYNNDVITLLSYIEEQRKVIDRQHMLLDRYEILSGEG